MRKRIFSILLALAMVVSVLPTTSFAAELSDSDKIMIAQSNLKDGYGLDLATYSVSAAYNAGSGKIQWNNTTHTLTLKNAAITTGTQYSSDLTSITLPKADCTLVLEGDNTITTMYRGIYLPDGASLTVKGTGSLDITVDSQNPGYGSYAACYGIGSVVDHARPYNYDADIIFESGNTSIHVKGKGGYGVVTGCGKILVNGGSLTVDTISGADTDGIETSQNIVRVSGGTVDVNVTETAIRGAAVRISGGTVNAVSTGIYSSRYGIAATNNGGKDDYKFAETDIFEEGGSYWTLCISGGTVTAQGYDALYSMDTIYLYGGNVTA